MSIVDKIQDVLDEINIANNRKGIVYGERSMELFKAVYNLGKHDGEKSSEKEKSVPNLEQKQIDAL